MGKPFNLTPEEVPEAKEYEMPIKEILDAFLQRTIKSVRVSLPNSKPESLYVALRKQVKESDAPVRVVKRKDKIYLVRR